MKVLIGGKEIDAEAFAERINIENALEAVKKACAVAEKEFIYLDCSWKQFRDAEVLLKMLKGECYECSKKARWLYVNREGDYAYLRCDDHKPAWEEENVNDFPVGIDLEVC